MSKNSSLLVKKLTWCEKPLQNYRGFSRHVLFITVRLVYFDIYINLQ